MDRYPLLSKVLCVFRVIGFLLVFGSPVYLIYGVINWVRSGVNFNQMLSSVVPGLLLYPAVWFIWGGLALGTTELVKVLVNIEANTRHGPHT